MLGCFFETQCTCQYVFCGVVAKKVSWGRGGVTAVFKLPVVEKLSEILFLSKKILSKNSKLGTLNSHTKKL